MPPNLKSPGENLKQIFLLILSVCLNLQTPCLANSPFEIVPTANQGRFLPAESYARQWLYHFSHQTEAAAVGAQTPLDLIWELHFFGFQNSRQKPLFWVEHKETRQLLGLSPQTSHVSYDSLKSALNSPEPNLAAVSQLILHHYSKAFFSAENRSGRQVLELDTLAPGLFVKWQDKSLIVISAPNFFPWQKLTSNTVIANSTGPTELKNSLTATPIVKDLERLLSQLLQFESFRGLENLDSTEFNSFYGQLKKSNASSKEINLQLEQKFPLKQRLAKTGALLKVLPGKNSNGAWYSLHALSLKAFNPASGKLDYVPNFTAYPNELFQAIRKEYFALKAATLSQNAAEMTLHQNNLSNHLLNGYALIAGKPYSNALGKQLHYPSLSQLKAERIYTHYPLTALCMAAYALALCLLALDSLKPKKVLTIAGFTSLALAFTLHTSLLALRWYILGRPPVANMFETVLYVPWIAVFFSFTLLFKSSNRIPLMASSCASLILLTLLQLNFYAGSFENIQAVLNSHYWLIIHVLMVVGSYGLFLLGSLLSHIYLIGVLYSKQETKSLSVLGSSILQVLYLGVALLIAGTLLGGVWAAQSWGRFWDWDPKESWAFISICIYLLWIHAYRFGKIKFYGLAWGAIFGFLAISFTWYGVNYILGTGLHSYGFGSGGLHYYYGFIFAELVFLAATIQNSHLTKDVDKKTPTC